MNPAAAAAIAPAASKVAEKSAEVIPFLIKTVVIVGGAIYLIHRYTNRFVKWDEKPGLPKANVTFEQADARADAIYNALDWEIFDDFDTVKANIQNLNYNGFVRVYNAFGNRAGNFVTGRKTMMEFLNDQLDSDELQELRFLMGGAFFKHMEKNLKYGLIAAGAISAGYLLLSGGDDAGSGIDPTGNGDVLDAGSGATPAFDAQKTATGLYNAMKDMGTNEPKILSLLTPITRAQFAEVYAAFGKRSYNTVTGSQHNPLYPLVSLPLLDLADWLYNELDDDDYELLRSKYPNYL